MIPGSFTSNITPLNTTTPFTAATRKTVAKIRTASKKGYLSSNQNPASLHCYYHRLFSCVRCCGFITGKTTRFEFCALRRSSGPDPQPRSSNIIALPRLRSSRASHISQAALASVGSSYPPTNRFGVCSHCIPALWHARKQAR